MPNTVPTLRPGPTQGGSGAYGAVPTIPDPFGTQRSAISGNMGNLGNLYGLTNSLNTNAAQQAVMPFQMNLPNYNAMTAASSGNILSKLKGQVPEDVARQIAQMAAERGAATGTIGAPNSNAALLRALGLTSLDLTNQGEQQLSGAVARTPTGQQFNPQQFLITPNQLQEAQYGSNVLGAAPDPRQAAQLGLRTAQSGMNFGGGGGFGGGSRGATDALGFPISNMSADQNFGPVQSYGAITRSGGDFGSSSMTGGFGASSSFGNQFGMPAAGDWGYGGFQPGDFEMMGFEDDQSPWQGSQWNTDMFADMGG